MGAGVATCLYLVMVGGDVFEGAIVLAQGVLGEESVCNLYQA
jgi:hypothetical protein